MPDWLQTAPTGPESGAEVVALIEQLTNWFFAGFMVLAVVFVVFAAWQFISSQGDPQGVGQARQKLLWSAVAIGAAVFARAIPIVIRSVVGG